MACSTTVRERAGSNSPSTSSPSSTTSTELQERPDVAAAVITLSSNSEDEDPPGHSPGARMRRFPTMFGTPPTKTRRTFTLPTSQPKRKLSSSEALRATLRSPESSKGKHMQPVVKLEIYDEPSSACSSRKRSKCVSAPIAVSSSSSNDPYIQREYRKTVPNEVLERQKQNRRKLYSSKKGPTYKPCLKKQKWFINENAKCFSGKSDETSSSYEKSSSGEQSSSGEKSSSGKQSSSGELSEEEKAPRAKKKLSRAQRLNDALAKIEQDIFKSLAPVAAARIERLQLKSIIARITATADERRRQVKKKLTYNEVMEGVPPVPDENTEEEVTERSRPQKVLRFMTGDTSRSIARSSKPCVFAGCSSAVANISRHYSNYHCVALKDLNLLLSTVEKLDVNLGYGDGPMPLHECFDGLWFDVKNHHLVESTLKKMDVTPSERKSFLSYLRRPLRSEGRQALQGSQEPRGRAQPTNSSDRPRASSSGDSDEYNLLLRNVSTCHLCSAVFISNRAGDHIRRKHKMQLGTEVKEAVTETRRSQRKVRLSRPLRSGERNIVSLIVEEQHSGVVNETGEADVRDEQEAEEGRELELDAIKAKLDTNDLKDGLVAWINYEVAMPSTKFHHHYPKIMKLLEMFKQYISDHCIGKDVTNCVRKGKYVTAIVLVYLVSVKAPSSADTSFLCAKVSEICKTYIQHQKKGPLEQVTILKHIQAMLDFSMFLWKKKDASGKREISWQTVENFRISVRSIMNVECSSNSSKSLSPLELSLVSKFLTSTYLQNVFEEANTNVDLQEGTEDVEEDKKYRPPNLKTALLLRNALITSIISRFGRTAHELATITLEGFVRATVLGKHHTILTLPKNRINKTAPCHFRLSAQEHDALIMFVRYYRPFITSDTTLLSPLFPSNASSVNFSKSIKMTTSRIGDTVTQTYETAGFITSSRMTPQRIRNLYLSKAKECMFTTSEIKLLKFGFGETRDIRRGTLSVDALKRKSESANNMFGRLLSCTDAGTGIGLCRSDTPGQLKERIRLHKEALVKLKLRSLRFPLGDEDAFDPT